MTPPSALAQEAATVDQALDTEVLFGEFRQRLEGYVQRRIQIREDAEDVLQDVFVRIHESLPRLAEIRNVSAWMYRITANAVVDYYRRRARSDALQDDGVQTEEMSAPPAEDNDAHRRLALCMEPFVQRLSEPYRQALLLTDLGEMTQTEAARHLSISVSGMKSRVQRGRAQLRDLVQNCCEVSLDGRGGVVDYQPRNQDPSHPPPSRRCDQGGRS